MTPPEQSYSKRQASSEEKRAEKKAKREAYLEANKERFIAYRKVYWAANREKSRAASAARRKAKLETYQAYRESHRAEHRALGAAYRTANKERIRDYTWRVRPRGSARHSWEKMKARRLNVNYHAYHNYGGRGITICERWLDSFVNFLADMGERPAGKSLDRYPDNNGNYELGSCRWATSKEQAANRRPKKRKKESA